MKFTLGHQRVLMGNDLAILIVADSGEAISRVRIEYDAATIADESLPASVTHYERLYSQMGGAAPRDYHKLSVTATSDGDRQQVGLRAWQDRA